MHRMKINRRKFIIKQFVKGFMSQGGFDWYVDSVNGNDGSDGKTPDTAFETIAQLLTQTPAAGATIGLAKGSHWHEELSGLNNGVKIYAYGAGDAPILDCSDVILTGAWSKSGGLTNVYQATLTSDYQASKAYQQLFEDDALLTRVADTATCDSTPGSYTVSSDEASPFTMYVHTTNSDNPAVNGSTYEYSARQYGLIIPQSGAAKGIITRRNNNNNGSLSIGANAVAVNCEAHDGGFHAVYVRGGATLINVIVRNFYHTATHSGIVINDNDGASQNVTLISCQVLQDSFDTASTGFSGHYNTGPDPFGTITYTNCVVKNCSFGFNFTQGHAAALVFTGCSTDDTQFPFDLSNPATLTNPTIRNTGAGLMVRGISIEAGSEAGVTIDGLDHDTPQVSGGAIYCTRPALVAITNSTINVDNPTGVRVGIYISNAGADFTLTGNTWTGTMTAIYNFANEPTYASDYNDFSALPNADFKIGGTTYTDSAAYVAGTNQDQHSTL